METVCKDSTEESVSLIQACDAPAATLSIDESDKQLDESTLAPIGILDESGSDNELKVMLRRKRSLVLSGIVAICCLVYWLYHNSANLPLKSNSVPMDEATTAVNTTATMFRVASPVKEIVKKGTVALLTNLATDAQKQKTGQNATAVSLDADTDICDADEAYVDGRWLFDKNATFDFSEVRLCSSSVARAKLVTHFASHMTFTFITIAACISMAQNLWKPLARVARFKVEVETTVWLSATSAVVQVGVLCIGGNASWHRW
jgi:hypothetical protein